MFSSTMAAKAKCCCTPRHIVAVLLVLFSMVSVLPCFTLRRRSGNVQRGPVVSETTTEHAIRTGIVIFNEKVFTSDSGSAPAAAGYDGTPSVDSSGAEKTENSIQTSPLQEAAWRSLRTALLCGETKMKFTAMGPGATDFQLDTGEGYTLPLNQVPETCWHSMRQNALGLVLMVPYDGCRVLRENGNYVLLLRWLDNTVKLICPILQSPDETPDSAKPPLTFPPQDLASPLKPWTMNRPKRQVAQPSSAYDPNNPNYLYWYYYYYYYYYYLYLAQNYPNYYNYPYYPYYPLPATESPDTTSAPPNTTTTAPTTTTTAPTTTTTTTAPAPSPTTTATTLTSTKSTVTTTTTVTSPTMKPTPDYTLPDVPDSGVIYYLPVIQNYYGNPPYQTMPIPTPQTTPDEPETNTTDAVTITVTPDPNTKTTKRCTKAITSSTSYERPNPYVEYQESPFGSVISYAERSKAAALPDFQSYVPEAVYKSGLDAGAYPDFSEVAAPWYPYHTGYEYIPT